MFYLSEVWRGSVTEEGVVSRRALCVVLQGLAQLLSQPLAQRQRQPLPQPLPVLQPQQVRTFS